MRNSGNLALFGDNRTHPDKVDWQYALLRATVRGCHMDKRLVIMRGIPGSGKSYRAKEIANGDLSCIYSADNFFMKDGVYQFDMNLIWPAHKQCRYESSEAMKAGKPLVIIDNTNIKIKEMIPFVVEGFWYDYHIELCEPTSTWWKEKVRPALDNKENEFAIIRAADVLKEKNVHGVPYDTIVDMIKHWQEATVDLIYERIFGPDHGLSF